jgi:cellulose synthase/poly-beta-1,6-N-acetylglucosamine synthase-like glycosyltransferase
MFLICAAWVVFAFVGYPLCMVLLARLNPRPTPSRVARDVPSLSVIVAVHNGEAHLAAKLENLLAQQTRSGFETIVTSDGSDDGTEAIARSFAGRGVRLVSHPERAGKEAAQARAVAVARGDLLVFSDVTAHLDPGALEAIVAPFADPEVGAVSSEDSVDSAEGEGLYVRYEMALRRAESVASTLVGLSGSFFAVRRELATPWPSDLASDFRMGLEAARRGFRAVSEPAATAHFAVIRDTGAEWRRKVRTIRRGIAVLLAYRELLSPRFGRVAFTLWGHKVARFTAPFAMIGALWAHLVWAGAAGFAGLPGGLLLLHLSAYLVGVVSLVWEPVARVGPARFLGFFLLVNAATLVAWFYHLSGRRAVVWQPTRR